MKFGTLYELMPGRPPWPEGREEQVYHEAIEQLVLTEELGFDYAWAVEHHFLEGYSSNSAPETFLAWAAGQTSRIRLGHGVVQLSKQMNHLVRVAERTAAIDIMSRGRLDVGTGRGFTADEVKAFGVDPAQTRPMQIHGMRTLPHLWAADQFELDDEFYTMPPHTLHPRPYQQPHPPLWMACTQPESWRMAGELGSGVLSFGFSPPDQLREQMATYRAAIATAERPYGVVNEQVAFATPFLCAETDEEALEAAAEAVLWFVECSFKFIGQWSQVDAKGYEFYRKLGTDFIPMPDLTPEEAAGLSPQAQAVKKGVKSGVFCVGSPQTCADVVQRYVDHGVDQLILVAQLGYMTNDLIQDSLRRFAAEVMPRFAADTAGQPVFTGAQL
jgi:alkanesulfonate monooxygenase SsuD/methylene tetrahydromethanopterin reductase-like flavin-dependent oxidoreductase (luciferase family)